MYSNTNGSSCTHLTRSGQSRLWRRSMSKSTTRVCRTRRFVDKRQMKCTSVKEATFLANLRPRGRMHARNGSRPIGSERVARVRRRSRSQAELNCPVPAVQFVVAAARAVVKPSMKPSNQLLAMHAPRLTGRTCAHVMPPRGNSRWKLQNVVTVTGEYCSRKSQQQPHKQQQI